MRITEFGEAVRAARYETRQTLRSMSSALGVSPAFLSSMETGRDKVPLDFVGKVEQFFAGLGFLFRKDELRKLAMVSNENAPLSGLSPHHQMLVAGFASSDFTEDQLKMFAEALDQIHAGRKESRHD
ncbi:MAG: helix-turn-helix domain-containing protein [Zoogloeaceae bacterium]|nr:helix-turn-helix domain-containing protein [Zoogloeaceae bacterium]